jgi:hypothetical protein
LIADRRHQLGARAHQALAHLQSRTQLLRGIASLVHRLQQRLVEATQTSQDLGIHSIALQGALGDQPDLARIDDHHIVAEISQQAIDPRRRAAALHDDAPALAATEVAAQTALGRRDTSSVEDLALLGQLADLGGFQVHVDAKMLHGRSPFVRR